MTAVEYIIDKMQNAQWEYTSWTERREIIEQAKQMEKQQQIFFATEFAKEYIGFDSVSSDPNAASPAAHYYNQTFKK